MIEERDVLKALSQIKDPNSKKDIVTLGSIRNLKISGGDVGFDIYITESIHSIKDEIREKAHECVSQLPGVKSLVINVTLEPKTSTPKEGRLNIPGVKNIIAVGSGKGGVGKSTISVNLACSFAKKGAKVGLLDADIYGPSIPIMMGGSNHRLRSDENRIYPPTAHGVKFMSMGFLAKGDEPLIWRGPMAHKAIEQCLFDVEWGELDYLILDLPPGTGDVHLTLMQSLDLAGGVIITTPQDVGFTISRKTLRMFQKMNVPLIGVIENMSTFQCSNCDHEESLFGSTNILDDLKELEVDYLGGLPFNKNLLLAADQGQCYIVDEPKSDISQCFDEILEKVINYIGASTHKAQPSPT